MLPAKLAATIAALLLFVNAGCFAACFVEACAAAPPSHCSQSSAPEDGKAEGATCSLEFLVQDPASREGGGLARWAALDAQALPALAGSKQTLEATFFFQALPTAVPQFLSPLRV
jgi:hypothetical protein